MRKVILASQSKSRRAIFASLGVPFKTSPANIDEKKIRDADLAFRAEKIARAKAEKVLLEEFGIVISCDTFSECNGKVLEKPKSLGEAMEMLRLLSGNKATNFTGFCYIDQKIGINFSTTVKTDYTLRELYESEIKEYVASFPVLEWAAAIALITPYTISLVAEINGSFTSFAYGLPIEVLLPLLKKSGFEPHPTIL